MRLAARGNLSTDDDDVRRCARCDRPLPAGSRKERRFCSTSCRVRRWHLDNPPPADAWSMEQVRLHWHFAGLSPTLFGFKQRGYWTGPEACPPECPGLRPPYTGSVAAIAGQEWRTPRAPAVNATGL
jgi:hypothetical protein